MKKRLAPAAFLLLTACQRSDVKVLIGATAIVAPGAQPIEDSIVIVSGRKIRSVGMRKDIPIPQDSERIDLSGKQIVPGDGSRIAVGEDSDIVVLDSMGKMNRHLVDGVWR